MYLNDAYKRAIIESPGQEEIWLDVYDIQPLKMQKNKTVIGGQSGIGVICKSSKYGGIIGLIYLPFVVSNS